MLEILAEFVCNSDMGVLAPMEQDVLRAHVADAACALVAGACSPEGIQLRALLRPGCAREEIGGIAAAIIRSTEVDDIHIESCVTPTSVAMPAALLAPNSDFAEAADAIRIGVELAVRMGLAIEGATALYRGLWPTCFATPIAVAAALCRLNRLDQERTTHALSMALMMSAGRLISAKVYRQPTGRWMPCLPGRFGAGRRACVCRWAEGYKGDPRIPKGHGLRTAVGASPAIGELLDDLARSRQPLPGVWD